MRTRCVRGERAAGGRGLDAMGARRAGEGERAGGRAGDVRTCGERREGSGGYESREDVWRAGHSLREADSAEDIAEAGIVVHAIKIWKLP